MKMFYLSECVGRHQTVLIVNVVQENRLETPFKGDNVKRLIKPSNCENLVLYFSEKSQKISAFAMLFGFLCPNSRLKKVLASPNDQKSRPKYPRYPLVLKFYFTLARPLCLVIPYFFRWKFLSDDRCLYLNDSKWNLRSDVDGFINTKQLLNLLCIL